MIITGDYRSLIGTADAIITDPPYSARTRRGHDKTGRSELGYAAWSPSDARDFAIWCSTHSRGWIVIITDHILARSYEAAFRGAGHYVFAPIPHVCPGRSVRLAGDGPGSWTDWIVVARPRLKRAWGTKRGAYITRPERGMARVGGKPLELMLALVQDYSAEGDMVVDPCAGGGTTGIACRILGRRFAGTEIDPVVASAANARLRSTEMAVQGVLA